ncbi:MAG: hypothetical protein Q9212_003882 [Teloschistes hypoglaucus]
MQSLVSGLIVDRFIVPLVNANYSVRIRRIPPNRTRKVRADFGRGQAPPVLISTGTSEATQATIGGCGNGTHELLAAIAEVIPDLQTNFNHAEVFEFPSA